MNCNATITPSRLLSYTLAREMSPEEVAQVSGGGCPTRIGASSDSSGGGYFVDATYVPVYFDLYD